MDYKKFIKYKIKIHSQGKIKSEHIGRETLLLKFLQEKGYTIYSPCGGNGKCGKCEVFIKGVGEVTSCQYRVEQDIEITIPDRSEVKILSSQYDHSIELPFNPGEDLSQFTHPLGMAIDLGTTTMVFYLMNLITGSLLQIRSLLNPQVKYGADVISRINYCIHNDNGVRVLQNEVIGVINEVIGSFSEYDTMTTSEIVKITVTGNTTMLHLLAGVNPTSLAYVPFKPVFTDAKKMPAHELGINSDPRALVHLLPSLTAYIGSDIIAGLCTLRPSESVRNYLFLDIGTNGEIALVTPQKIFFCATAAGPAFEGANISCGIGGIEGAISAFGTWGYRTIGDSEPIGICGSGLLDIIAWLLDKGIISKEGYMEHEYTVVHESLPTGSKAIKLTPSDVRELQLAKAAIAAGINILLSAAGLQVSQLDAMFLAGGFGNYLNVDSALKIGLIPHHLKNKIFPVGNTAGTGAMFALKSAIFKDIMDQAMEKAYYIDLSRVDSFTEEFAMNMRFP